MPNDTHAPAVPLHLLIRTASTKRLLLVYFGICGALLYVVLRGSAGFSYALDDPYIHLALAQHMLHGTYGVNAGETTSPSSSVIWPLLLVPFAESAIRGWIPLLLNLLSGVGCCALMGGFLERWYLERWPACGRLAKWSLAVLFVFAANLAGLAFLGMEHTLQVMLTIGCAWGIMEAYAGRCMPRWTLVMAALAPAVRYEDLAFTLSVVLACALQGRRRAATVTGVASLLPLAGLGLFLHAHGLAVLPNSVIVKGGVISARPHFFAHAPLLDHFLTIVAVNAREYVITPDRWPIVFFAVVLAVQVRLRWRNRTQRNALGSALIGLVLIMAIGPYGYLFRYDTCYRLFAFLVSFAVLADSGWFRPMVAEAFALVAACVSLLFTPKIPREAWNIAHEQKLMQQFSHRLYGRNIAVNDLGWVSFDSQDRFYVLDLGGLASNEASKQRIKDAAWLESITRRHDVGLVMIYRSWFVSVPADWTEVAELHRLGGGPDLVSFYVTPVGDVPTIRAELQTFAHTLPEGTWITTPGERRQ